MPERSPQMEPLTQSALWQLVLGLAGLILTLAGILYVVDKCGTQRSEKIAKRATDPAATDVVAAAPDAATAKRNHKPLP